MKLLTIASLLVLLTFSSASAKTDEIRVGIIGLDTSHVVVFTRMFNDTEHKDHVPGARVVAAFKGGSPDIESSWSRGDGYTENLQHEFRVRIVNSIEQLCTQLGAIMLESV